MPRGKRFRISKPAQTVATLLLAAAVTIGVIVGWQNWQTKVEAAANQPGHVYKSSIVAAPPSKVVSVLSDSHAYNADSWFRLSVEDGNVPGATVGTFASYPGGDVDVIRAGLPKIEGSDAVIVQAGTNNLIEGDTPAATAAQVSQLAEAAAKRVPLVILATIPPSNERPTEVVEANRLLREWASAHSVPMLDTYTAAATPSGEWREGFTDDQRHANERGSRVLAGAVERQLPALLD